MAVTATIQNAMRIFKYNPKATKWLPKTNLKNATVSFEKVFAEGKPVAIQKVVTRADGQVLRGNFDLAGNLTGASQVTSKGSIITTFGSENYDKVIDITTKNGENITRLTHRNRPQSFLDSYSSKNGIRGDGNYTAEYNRLRAEVQNAPKRPQWLEDLVKEWNA